MGDLSSAAPKGVIDELFEAQAESVMVDVLAGVAINRAGSPQNMIVDAIWTVHGDLTFIVPITIIASRAMTAAVLQVSMTALGRTWLLSPS